MLVAYARDQLQGADPRILSAIGKEILTAVKALGQHVTLPPAPTGSGAAAATQAAVKGKIDVKAWRRRTASCIPTARLLGNSARLIPRHGAARSPRCAAD
jgi:hypothetical protein